MNRKDLVQHIAATTKFDPRDIDRVLTAALQGMTATLARKENITLRGFGTFKNITRAPRKARHIKAGHTIHLPQRTIIKFIPGKHLKP